MQNEITIKHIDVKWTLILILSTSVGFLLTYNNDRLKYSGESYDFETGFNFNDRRVDFIRFVFIGRSSCRFSNYDKTHGMVRHTKDILKRYSDSLDVRFLSTGVSLDNNANRGVEYLLETGPYDEIVSGSGLHNSGYSEFVWQNELSGGTPQMLAFRYTSNMYPTGRGIEKIRSSSDLIFRAVGIDEIDQINRRLSAGDSVLVHRMSN